MVCILFQSCVSVHDLNGIYIDLKFVQTSSICVSLIRVWTLTRRPRLIRIEETKFATVSSPKRFSFNISTDHILPLLPWCTVQILVIMWIALSKTDDLCLHIGPCSAVFPHWCMELMSIWNEDVYGMEQGKRGMKRCERYRGDSTMNAILNSTLRSRP